MTFFASAPAGGRRRRPVRLGNTPGRPRWPSRRRCVRVVTRLHAPHHSAFFAPYMAMNGVPFSRINPSSSTADERRLWRSTGPAAIPPASPAQRRSSAIGAPGVRALAVVLRAEHVGAARPPLRRERRCPGSAQHGRCPAPGRRFIREQVAGAAEVGLHLVEDENQVVLPGKMLGASANRLPGDEEPPPPRYGSGLARSAAGQTPSAGVQFPAVRRRIERWPRWLNPCTRRREADEADARIAVMVALAAGHGVASLFYRGNRGAWPGSCRASDRGPAPP